MKLRLLTIILAAFACLPSLQSSPVRDLQRELNLDDSKWKVTKETDTQIMWATPSAMVITLCICEEETTEANPHHLKQMRNYYRAEAAETKGSLVEAEPRASAGILFNLVTVKVRIGAMHQPPDDAEGFIYLISANIPTTKGLILLQVTAMERGITGIRESAGLVVYMKELGVKDVLVAAKTFTKDPYDPAFNKDARYMVSDERRFDKGFPDHPLSQIRALMDEVTKSWTIPERIQKIARYHEGKRQTD